jgi:hypothetical protein
MVCSTLGLDSLEHCFDKNHYRSYPDNIVYKFNSMGYRTSEKIQGDEILAIGDSFTLGLGVNVEDTWSAQLSTLLNYPVLNFSLNGASNDWIARRSAELLKFVKPRAIVVHYTFSHRREHPFSDWHDDERTECEPIYTDEQNLINWQENFKKINSLEVPVIHSFIQNWHTTSVCCPESNVIMPTSQVDYARDRFHYGPITHSKLAEQIAGVILTAE